MSEPVAMPEKGLPSGSNWELIASAGTGVGGVVGDGGGSVGSDRTAGRKLRWRHLRQYRFEPADWLKDSGWLWRVDQLVRSTDGRVAKFRYGSVEHGDACESVWMRSLTGRVTVCVSTQIGCGVGCVFCATGRMGFRRNLSSWEILEQVLRSGAYGPSVESFGAPVTNTLQIVPQPRPPRQLRPPIDTTVDLCETQVTSNRRGMEQGKRGHNGIPPVRNIVFMGMGEPLHNVDAVVQAIEKLTDEDWFGISQRSITVSTAGVPRGMIMLAERFPRLRLALSLHSGDPRKRRELVPHAVGDLQRLRETISIVNSIQEGPVWIEIALLDGVNDGLEDAKGVIEFCKGLRVEVNVIPYNDTSHASFEGEVSFRAPVVSRVDEYIRELRRSGLFTTYRKTQGESIQAACGQLISQ